MAKRTKFNLTWLTKPEYKDWIMKKDTYAGYCLLCSKTIELSNMGEAALKSHAKGGKHQSALGASVIRPISSFCKSEIKPEVMSGKPSEAVNSTFSAMLNSDVAEKSEHESNIQNSNLTIPPPPLQPEPLCKPKIPQSQTISSWLIREETKNSEILWTIACILNHISINTGSKMSKVCTSMFKDSTVAGKLSLGATKMSYLLNFGIAPYFRKLLLDDIKASPYYVLSFDESFNSVLQKEQLDIIIRYFCQTTGKVESRYFCSEFLGHTRAEDIVEALLQQNLPERFMMQISMDGPNVNLKVLKDLNKRRKLEKMPQLLDTGTCSLHTLHNAFKCAYEQNANVHVLLKAAGKLFRKTPARFEDFKSITGTSVIPLSFCGTRWIEDQKVAERLVQIWPNIVKFITETEKKQKKDIPKTNNYDTVKSAVTTDKLVIPKLKEFISIASTLRPYLTKFQGDGPLMPFVCSELLIVLTDLMSRFIKPEKRQNLSMFEAATLSLEKDNQVKLQQVSISYAAKAELNALKAAGKISELQILDFRSQCLNIYKAICEKMQEKSPLKYTIPRKMVCLNPKVIIIDQTGAEKAFSAVLTKLADNQWIQEDQPEVILSQFRRFSQECKKDKEQEFLGFDPRKDRLDEFFSKLLKDSQDFQDLWKVIMMILTLSHGQATVERGFSVNKDALNDNLQEMSLVSRRIVFDALKDVDLEEYQIPKGLCESCNHASNRYRNYLDKKEKDQAKQTKETKRKAISEELEEVKKRKMQLEKNAASLTDEADAKSMEAEKSKNPRQIIIQANASRAKAKELKDTSIPHLDKTIKELQDQMKTYR